MFKIGFYEKIGYKIFSEDYKNYQKSYESYMNKYEISFLLGLISDYTFNTGMKIKNVLDVGIYNGVTSLYMLKEGNKKNDDFILHSIELMTDDFFGEAVINESSEKELKNYNLNKGCTTLNIESCIDSDQKIDLAFIDAGHSHPHPIIDLICIIPYLHDESLVFLHDVVDYMRPNAWGESFVYTQWSEKKYRPYHLDNNYKPTNETSLGCIEIPRNNEILYENLLKIVKIPFRAAPWKFDDIWLGISKKDIKMLEKFMIKHYDKNFVKKVIEIFYKNLKEYNETWNLRHHETKFYNYLFEKTMELEKSIMIQNQNLQVLEKKVKDVRKTDKNLKKTIDKNKKLIKENKKMKSSNSWKITEPLRKIGKKIK